MTFHPRPGESHGRTAVGLMVVAIGMAGFALCAHQGMPWRVVAMVSLLVVAATIGWMSHGDECLAATLGLDRCSLKTAFMILIGTGIGIGGGLWHRSELGIATQGVIGVEPFVIVACLIGATEELVFRGWFQGKAIAFGWPAAVIASAVAHAAYKTTLFVWPAGPVAVDLAGVARWTLAGGIVLGLLRVMSGSVIPSIMAHAVFDFVVYRLVANAPWWVWE